MSLAETQYLSFPFKVGQNGPKTSSRAKHVREQIEQVLFTSPKERVFRPEFGVGVRRLVFEPNSVVLRNSTIKQLNASLADALHGEVDPKTLTVDIVSDEHILAIHISYILAAINRKESHSFKLTNAGLPHG